MLARDQVWAFCDNGLKTESLPNGCWILSSSALLELMVWWYVLLQGDSGFLVYRRGYIVLSSRPQQLEFNCPFQLAAQGQGNTAYDADVDNFVTEPGDIIVLGR